MPAPNALILAGGESRRWQGRDKGLIAWKHVPLVEHVIQRLLHQVSGITISCNRNTKQYRRIHQRYKTQLRQQTLPDIINDKVLVKRGPLGGIYEFLKLATHPGNLADTDNVLICCCDTPLLPLNLVDLLNVRLQESTCSAVYPRFENTHYWLNLLVNAHDGYLAIENMLATATNHRDFSIKNWLKKLDAQSIQVESSNNYTNVNDEATLALLDQLPLTSTHKKALYKRGLF